MATTTFTDKVEVLGSQDINQLNVKAFSTQTQPLETWQSNAGTNLAQMTGDGRLEIGNNLGVGAPHDAVIDVNQDVTVPSSSPTSGIHSLGRITGTISSPVNWTVEELQLNGTGGVSGLHIAKKVKLTNNNTGACTTAELRGTDSTSVNTAGSGGAYVMQVTGVRGTASNAPSAFVTTAAGVEATVTNDTGATVTNAMAVNVAAPTNNGTITNLYGLNIPNLTQGTNNYSIYTGTAPSYFGGMISGSMDTMTYATTISLDVTKPNLHKTTTVHATGNATINASAVGVAGQHIWVLIINDATSGKVITFGTNFKPNGTLTGTISKAAMVHFVSDGINFYEVARTLNL